MTMQHKPTTITTAMITQRVAGSAWSLFGNVRRGARNLHHVERELDNAGYWLTLWLQGNSDAGKSTRHIVSLVNDLLATAADAVERRRRG